VLLSLIWLTNQLLKIRVLASVSMFLINLNTFLLIRLFSSFCLKLIKLGYSFNYVSIIIILALYLAITNAFVLISG
jgi:hypothetical protein